MSKSRQKHRTGRRRNDRQVTETGSTHGTAPWWVWVPTAVVLVWYATLYVRQQVFNVPVPNRVMGGETVSTDRLMLGWAPDHEAQRRLEIQISGRRDFRELEFTETAPSTKKRVMVRPGLEPGVYYWRMRSIIDDNRSPWTRRIRFTVVE